MTGTAHRHRSALAAIAAMVALVAGVRSMGAEPVAMPERPNLIVITMEATRPDHIGCYDDPRAETPALDRLGTEGAILDAAIAAAPLTLPSHASIFTALYPPRHGVRGDEGSTLDRSKPTLAAHLKAQGFATTASVGNSRLGGAIGLKRGFDSFAAPRSGSRRAAEVVDDAIAAIDRVHGHPFFLWVQCDDPHAPYEPPPPYGKKFAGRPYDGEIASMDAQIKRLLEHLRARALLDKTIVVATADHGESLGEHGEETHGLLVYDATLRVPLIVRYPPKATPGTRVKAVVSLVDLAPTVLELLGLPPMAGVQGTSFAPALHGAGMSQREPAYAESLMGEQVFGWAPLYALRTATRKFIDAPNAEVYDIKRDPSETIDMADKDAPVAAEARAQVDQLRRSIGDSAGGTAKNARARPDPKSLIAVGNLFITAKATIEAGRPQDAASLLERALAKDPSNRAVTSLLAALRGQAAESAAAAPDTFAGQFNRGNALYVQGKLDESAKAFRAALALNPSSAKTQYALGNVLAAQGDTAGAVDELRAAVASDPKLVEGWNALGIVLDKSKRRAEALDAFSRALEVNPDHADALFNRAKLELMNLQLKDARRDLDRLLKARADYAPGLFLEAHLCDAEKNPAGVKASLTKFLALPNLDPRMKAAAEDMMKKAGD